MDALLDILRLIKRYCILVIAIPLLTAGICLCYLQLKPASPLTFRAVTTIALNSQAALVGNLANAEARAYAVADSPIEFSVDVDIEKMSVKVSARSGNADLASAASADVAEAALSHASELLSDALVKDQRYSFRGVILGTQTNEVQDESIWRPVGISFAGGVVVALLIVLFINAVKRPILDVAGLRRASRYPVLGECSSVNAIERTAANVHFSLHEKDAATVYIFPTDAIASADRAKAVLDTVGDIVRTDGHLASQASDPSLPWSHPYEYVVSRNGEGFILDLLRAKDHDGALISVAIGKDSYRKLDALSDELELANVPVIGVVAVPNAKDGR